MEARAKRKLALVAAAVVAAFGLHIWLLRSSREPASQLTEEVAALAGAAHLVAARRRLDWTSTPVASVAMQNAVRRASSRIAWTTVAPHRSPTCSRAPAHRAAIERHAEPREPVRLAVQSQNFSTTTRAISDGVAIPRGRIVGGSGAVT
jgi:hypothetical protein